MLLPTPISQLTPSGEVAVFVDDDQFDGGSPDKCGPEAVALVYHAVKPGEPNTYAVRDVHNMARSDYAAFIGPDVPTDEKGTTESILYKMLTCHGFPYVVATPTIDTIIVWLKYGYPVILAMYEDSVVDAEVGTNPYPWPPIYSHIIVASGFNDTHLLVRDTANIKAPNTLRPGPRQYDSKLLRIISATVVVPGWLPTPPTGFNPLQAIESGGGLAASDDDLATWRIINSRIAFNADAAIEKAWLAARRSGREYGPPIENERKVGNTTVQNFLRGLAAWDGEIVTWRDGRGKE